MAITPEPDRRWGAQWAITGDSARPKFRALSPEETAMWDADDLERLEATTDVTGRASDECYVGNHSDCHDQYCQCNHHNIDRQYSGACADEDHNSCRMDGCPCVHHHFASLRIIAQDGGGGDGGGGDAGGGGGSGGDAGASAATSSGTAECGSTTDTCNNGCGGTHANAAGCSSCGCRGFLFGGYPYGRYREPEHKKKKKKHHKGAIEAPAGVTAQAFPGEDDVWRYHCTDCDYTHDNVNPDIKRCPGCGGENTVKGNFSERLRDTGRTPEWRRQNPLSSKTADHVYDDDEPTCAEDNQPAIGEFLGQHVCKQHLEYALRDAPDKLAKAKEGIEMTAGPERLAFENQVQQIKGDIDKGEKALARAALAEDDTGGLERAASTTCADCDDPETIWDDCPACTNPHEAHWINKNGQITDNFVCHSCGYRCRQEGDRLVPPPPPNRLQPGERFAATKRTDPDAEEGLAVYKAVQAEDEADARRKGLDQAAKAGYEGAEVKGTPQNTHANYWNVYMRAPRKVAQTQETNVYECERCGVQATHEAVTKGGSRRLLCVEHATSSKIASDAVGLAIRVFAIDASTALHGGSYGDDDFKKRFPNWDEDAKRYIDEMAKLTPEQKRHSQCDHASGYCAETEDNRFAKTAQPIDLTNRPLCKCEHPLDMHDEKGNCQAVGEHGCQCQIARPKAASKELPEWLREFAAKDHDAEPDPDKGGSAFGGSWENEPDGYCKGCGQAIYTNPDGLWAHGYEDEDEDDPANDPRNEYDYQRDQRLTSIVAQLTPGGFEKLRAMSTEEREQLEAHGLHYVQRIKDKDKVWTKEHATLPEADKGNKDALAYGFDSTLDLARDEKVSGFKPGDSSPDSLYKPKGPIELQDKGICPGPGCTTRIQTGEGFLVGDTRVCGQYCAENLMNERNKKTAQNLGCPNCGGMGSIAGGMVCPACFGTGHGGGLMLKGGIRSIGDMQPHCADCGSHLQADEHSHGSSPMYYCGGGCGEYKQGDEIEWRDESGATLRDEGVSFEGARDPKNPDSATCERCGGRIQWNDEDDVWEDESNSILCGGNQPHEPDHNPDHSSSKTAGGDGLSTLKSECSECGGTMHVEQHGDNQYWWHHDDPAKDTDHQSYPTPNKTTSSKMASADWDGKTREELEEMRQKAEDEDNWGDENGLRYMQKTICNNCHLSGGEVKRDQEGIYVGTFHPKCMTDSDRYRTRYRHSPGDEERLDADDDYGYEHLGSVRQVHGVIQPHACLSWQQCCGVCGKCRERCANCDDQVYTYSSDDSGTWKHEEGIPGRKGNCENPAPRYPRTGSTATSEPQEGVLLGDDGSTFYTSDGGKNWDKIGATEHSPAEDEEDDDIKIFKFDHGPGQGNDLAHSEIHEREHLATEQEVMTGRGCGRCGSPNHTSERCPSNRGSTAPDSDGPTRYLDYSGFQPQSAAPKKEPAAPKKEPAAPKKGPKNKVEKSDPVAEHKKKVKKLKDDIIHAEDQVLDPVEKALKPAYHGATNPASGPIGTSIHDLVDNVPALEPFPTGQRPFITDHKGEVDALHEPDSCKFCGEPMQDHAQWNPTHQVGDPRHASTEWDEIGWMDVPPTDKHARRGE